MAANVRLPVYVLAFYHVFCFLCTNNGVEDFVFDIYRQIAAC